MTEYAEDLAQTYLLETARGMGPQKFRALHRRGLRPAQIVADPALLPEKGLRGETLRREISAISPTLLDQKRRMAEHQLKSATRLGGRILVYDDPEYPRLLYESSRPSPVLYVRGSPDALGSVRNVACVGSRAIAEPYESRHRGFAETAVEEHFAVVSGFALGADTVGHRAAVESGGMTICVMPGGLDRPFPPENRSFWSELLKSDRACLVSEFAFGMAASSLTLRRRNAVIVAFSLGVLVSQSSAEGGAMNAYRFAREQKKPVATFASNATPATSGNAVIEADRRPGDVVFEARSDAPSLQDRQAFREWLSTLS